MASRRKTMKDRPVEGSSTVSPPGAPIAARQILRQVAVIVVVVVVWTAVLVGYLALTKPSDEAPEATPAPPQGPEVSFSADVLPIFEVRCQSCHGTGRAEAGLSLASHADVIAGSGYGPVVTADSAKTSRLVEIIVSGDMPPG
ncbi:MAG: hypothetical protein GWN58_58710, partial [Anaerolineae bacterium]|nr:hypothetical protein [Anaerolineae bacterium]